uniref:Papain-like cysteine peptidase n=1 Tax=viral metagenome TaxID=1070528 RepID=A0A6C0LCY7_9ZZZZ
MYNLDLCHLGNQCAPGIIIDDILNVRKKTLFMLGIYHFNDILEFLKDGYYEKIYDRNFLENQENNNVRHSLYKFTFNHEFTIENWQITNYDLVKNRFDEKIRNFREMLHSNNKTIFINVFDNIDTLNIDGMLNWLRENKRNFHLIIITDKHYNTGYESENLSIIKLENSFSEWWNMSDNTKANLYQEMYNKFITCLEHKNIENNFPKNYMDTEYGRAHPV